MQAESEAPAVTRWVKMEGGIKKVLCHLYGRIKDDVCKSRRKPVGYL